MTDFTGEMCVTCGERPKRTAKGRIAGRECVPCHGLRYKAKRKEHRRMLRRLRKAGLAIAASVLLWACVAGATVIPLEVVAPCTNDDGSATDSTGRCTDCTPLTDLKQLVLYGTRCGAAHAESLGVVPALGRECDTLRFDVTLPGGTTYDLFMYADDTHGNRSLRAVHHSIAVPFSVYEPGLWGTYYADTAFASPVNGRVDANIDFAWGTSPPIAGITSGRWAVRWTGRLRTLAPGTYTFRAYINNGFRMWIGGQSVMCCDSWSNPNTHWSTGTATLAGGTDYPFTAEYRNEFYEAFVYLYWTPPDGSEHIIPASAFVQEASP